MPYEPIASDGVPWTQWSEVPRFGLRWRHLTRAAVGEDYHVGVAIEELAPGMRSAPAHWHVHEEEHVYVLDGALTAGIGARRFPMRAGDYVCFPAGQPAEHCLSNEGTAPCRYVIVGEHDPNEVVVYPDSRKVLVRALGRRAIFDLDARRGYWDGEDTGLAAGASPAAEAEEAPASIVPKPPISSQAVAWTDEGPGRGTVFGGRSKHLTMAAVGRDYHVGVLIESPAPGMRLCPRHYHMLEEEHALVLHGEVSLLLGEDRFVMRAGDYVCFPAGWKVGHSFLNSGAGPCSYLMIGERNPNEVCVYPDSNKLAVDALRGEDNIFDMAGRRAYWDGERTD
jgi:uncharacterized cupin superfamily protein